jgi:hypothetical protein
VPCRDRAEKYFLAEPVDFRILERRTGERISHMKYLMLICGNEAGMAQATPEQMKDMMGAYAAFTHEAKEKKVYLGGERLRPVSTATTVRVRDGKLSATDGPFAETKEQLGGYYLLDCKDLDEAIEYAAKIPAASSGSVEIRPIWT